MARSQRSPRLILDRASVTRILTAAETLALNATPIELVAAPGAGRFIVPEMMIVSKAAGAAGAAGGNLQLRVGSSTLASATRAQAFPAGAVNRAMPVGAGNAPTNGNLNVNMATAAMTGQNRPVTVTVVYSVYEA